MRPLRVLLGALSAAAIGVAVDAGCNVWASLENCSADSDCPNGRTCAVERVCVTSPGPDSSSDASIADARPADSGHILDAGTVDADAAPARICDSTKAFGTPVLVAGLEGQETFSARLSADELTMFYAIMTATNGTDIYQATRSMTDASFESNGPMPSVNTAADEYWPTLSADGRLVFFESGRSLTPDEAGVYHNDQARIWSSSRVSVLSDFGPPGIDTLFVVDGGAEAAPYLHPSGRSLYFASGARGGFGDIDLFVAMINQSGVVTSVNNIAAVNSPVEENMPVVSADELELYFARFDQVLNTTRNIWVSRRTQKNLPFGAPMLANELNTVSDEFPSFLSADGCRLFFISNRPAAIDTSDAAPPPYRVWVAER